jgi:anti-anti-sigma regulatory factor
MVLKLEGRLADQWVDELTRASAALGSEGPGMTLDLDGLSFIDVRGIAWLHDARARGARLSGGSSFIAALIEETAQ